MMIDLKREKEVGFQREGRQNKSDMHTRAPSVGGRETERVEFEWKITCAGAFQGCFRKVN